MSKHPEPKELSVQLLSYPVNPLEMLWVVWMQSRHNRPLPTPHSLALALAECRTWPTLRPHGSVQDTMRLLGYDPIMRDVNSKFVEDFDKTIAQLIGEDIPVTENMTFVFLFENMPISLREQMVRHRIGTSCGPRLGADIVPDLAESSWWSQTMRVLDMGTFYDDGQFVLPDSVCDKYAMTPYGSISVKETYLNTMRLIQEAYKTLVAAGVPKEDARQIIPLGTTHRITWMVNLKVLLHIIGKRSCWISQNGMWGPLLEGIVSELRDKVSPALGSIIDPPCIKGDAWHSCPFDMINQERVSGADGFPPCPLWLNHRRQAAKIVMFETHKNGTFPAWVTTGSTVEKYNNYPHGQACFPDGWVTNSELQAEQMVEGRATFRKLWRRDVDSGSPLSAADLSEESA